MRTVVAVAVGAMLGCGLGCARGKAGEATSSATPAARPAAASPSQGQAADGEWLGFDRNDYPGDDAMRALHRSFAFTGYWLTPPPGETSNSWVGKRATLKAQGWGFLLLANGRLDAEILKEQEAGTRPAALAQKDAAAVMTQARAEGFPAHAVLFLDQEEGGRLLPEQAAYLLGWTEAVAQAGFRPGVYASGQQVEDSPGQRIDTVEDIRARVTAGHLHPVAIFDALDQCPPAPGCTLGAAPLRSLPDDHIDVWQYAQSPRRPAITQSCAATYNSDGNCYAPNAPSGVFLDMNVATSGDPSGGRQ